ncbi:MAG TPA: hypothetical protein DCQ94_06760 [Nitrospira sp.]|uniref:ATP-binding protein n=1 Tax=Candidatus Nitrosymbiomonas proteolyticus TaxID=2608984 RepID=A0A809RFG2_9BACT|nr:ATP-binding protein [Candidatus Nitrosymbiomonas proteolyticus]HAP39442.1 hypothetical protein [Nitrospira sp.]
MAVISIDRIGDLADRLIARSAAAKIRPGRVVIIDPCDPDWVVPWNPFLQPGDPFRVADGFVDAVERQATSWGVQIDSDMRNISRALVMTRNSPLEIERMYTDDEFRASVAAKITDVCLRNFLQLFDRLTPEQRLQRQMAVSNKLQNIISNPRLRRILCGKGTINLQQIVDDPAAILLVALRKDQLHGSGDFLGDMVMQGVWNAVLSRATIPEDKRVKSTLILDEGQNFAKGCLAEIITEGRRYGLRLVFAHQSQAQIEPGLRAIMRNNCAVQLVFNVGPIDAKEMSQMLMPLSRIEATDAILRLKVGETFVVRQGMYPIRVVTPNADPVDMSLVPEFRKQSMFAHGQGCEAVDAEIASRWTSLGVTRDSLGDGQVEVRHVRKPQA